MKKLVYSILAIAFITACNQGTDGFTLNGTMSGELENGTKVFLKKTNEQNMPVDVDTTTIANGKYSFKGNVGSPELHYIFVDKVQGNIPVIIEEGEILVKAQKDSLAFAQLEGTPQNNLFTDFLEESRALTLRAMSMQDDMRAASAEQDSAAREAAVASLRDEYIELQDEAKKFELDYARENPNALISALIIDKVLTTKTLPEDEVKVLFEALTPEIKETTVGKKIAEKLGKAKSTAIGAKAPNFSAPTPDGQELALNEVLGRATIVDFWAAWCRPCREENPNVVAVYNKYHEKGLNILGVSLDRKAEDWKKAIKDDGLLWNHVSNVNYFDEIAQLYNVDAIPATFILDENGVIVAKDLRGPELEKKIAEMLQ